ncbi:MAG: metal-sensitive transcriptional regulator [Candidatus Dojkabacteria bacterium]
MTDSEHIANKKKASISVKKSQGIINKILKMVEEDKYCPGIIQQVDAAIGLLKSSKKTLLIGHLDHCLEDKLKEDKHKAINELVKIFDLK